MSVETRNRPISVWIWIGFAAISLLLAGRAYFADDELVTGIGLLMSLACLLNAAESVKKKEKTWQRQNSF